MIRVHAHRLLVAGFTALIASAAWADGFFDLWNKERATYFAAVCLETAPSFESARAVDQRRKSWESAYRLQRPAEVWVDLYQDENRCYCRTGFRSGDVPGLKDMVVDVAVDEYEDQLLGRSTSPDLATFGFDAQEVVVYSCLHEDRGATWVIAVAAREGVCPE